ncbi:hypothetical protein B7P43_G16562 [Cryptotermes secundus]|uniref:Uncharacterized protein n=1 Tax=Cryptotermes secundus TaxID=105785 RepID=A0A2J7RES0_9NEOP|nr:hypothetical protein B7P43_G16562 [Cryptotermes secundus]
MEWFVFIIVSVMDQNETNQIWGTYIRRGNNTKMDLTKTQCEGVGWIEMAQNTVQRRLSLYTAKIRIINLYILTYLYIYNPTAQDHDMSITPSQGSVFHMLCTDACNQQGYYQPYHVLETMKMPQFSFSTNRGCKTNRNSL